MKIIVGLGNPGREYEHTRHNAGYDTLMILAGRAGILPQKSKCRCRLGEGLVEGERLILAWPETFMNLSGEAVVDLMNWYKAEPQDILILYDDIDLPFGKVRIRPFGGAGTHNGMRNILYLTGSDRFPRIRIGMGGCPPEWDLKDWVLSGYRTAEERQTAYDAFCLAADAALCFAKDGIDLAMNRFNK